jgi:hypothetical protein
MESMKSHYLLNKRDMCLNKQLLCIKAPDGSAYTKGNVYNISWVDSKRDFVTFSSDYTPTTWSIHSLIFEGFGSMYKKFPTLFINAHKFSDESIFLYKLSGNLEDLTEGLSDLLDIDT